MPFLFYGTTIFEIALNFIRNPCKMKKNIPIKQIARNYATGWFTYDLITLIRFDAIYTNFSLATNFLLFLKFRQIKRAGDTIALWIKIVMMSFKDRSLTNLTATLLIYLKEKS